MTGILRLTVAKKRLRRFLTPRGLMPVEPVEDTLEQLERAGQIIGRLTCCGCKLSISPLRRRPGRPRLLALTVVGYAPDGSDVNQWAAIRGLRKKAECWSNGTRVRST